MARAEAIMFFTNIFLCFIVVKNVGGQFYNERLLEFVQIFSSCRRSDTKYFDVCMLRALNDAREFFESGVPEFNVAPFDPFYAHEVTQTRGLPAFKYKLILRNVYESGWVNSEVTEFKSDLKDGYIRYRQFFPEKFLNGGWQMYNNFLTPYSNSGTFDLSLYNYTQVTTIRRRQNNSDPENPFSVHIKAMECDDLKLHISNLLKGRKTLEKILDRLINFGWRPGFNIVKPLIDDLVSTAFTKIFNDDFRHFPFDAVIPRLTINRFRSRAMPFKGDQRSVDKWYVNHQKPLISYISGCLPEGECREKRFKWTKFRCPNNRSGCLKEGTAAEMKKHLFECYHRWICCAWHLQCGRRRIKLSEYKGHLEGVHRPYIKKIWLNEEEEIVVKTDRNSVVRTGNILRAEGVYFVRRFFLDFQEDVLIISLHIVGENEEARHYMYRIKINQGFHRAEYSWTSYCLPYAENVNSCAVLSKCEVLNPSKVFLTKDYLHEIRYSMTIKRIHNDPINY